MDYVEFDVVKIPDGQSRESFLDSKINQLKRLCELSSLVVDDIECFDEWTKLEINQTFDVKLLQLLERFEEAHKK